MKDSAFQELMGSVGDAGRIRRGTLKPSRTTVFKPEDVKAVRTSLGASQSEGRPGSRVAGLPTVPPWHFCGWQLRTQRPSLKPCTGRNGARHSWSIMERAYAAIALIASWTYGPLAADRRSVSSK